MARETENRGVSWQPALTHVPRGWCEQGSQTMQVKGRASMEFAARKAWAIAFCYKLIQGNIFNDRADCSREEGRLWGGFEVHEDLFIGPSFERRGTTQPQRHLLEVEK